MLIAIILILIGLALLVVGGEVLLRGAVGLAQLWKLTPAVIGLTVVAAGTSVPELAVSTLAATQGKADIAVANAVGSNIFNVTFILGLNALICPLAIGGNTIKLEYPVLALVTLMAVAVCHDGEINRIDATLFLAVYVGFTVYMVGLVREQMSAREETEFQEEVNEMTVDAVRQLGLIACLGLVVVGVALLGFGAQAMVSGAVELARLLGMSERLIGLTIVSIGTGLPEVVTSLVSSIRGRDDVAIGNVLGSNLFNILGILGLSAMASPLSVNPMIIASDNWWMLGVTLLIFPLMYTSMKIRRWEGALLLGVYVSYVGTLLARPG